ncbi:DNRLRE domain-containing protein [Streptomyces cyaneofuscatus]|uniref:DNRLRE domain-containing protein n=1 Tax=Streptomyces cyaneofuscatus TaxID=66883 RepID=A0ABZ1F369_9ACTN|nr:DNRLRE domain-containing protein [Streptomyces cyaneofuscatus]WSB10854.1 DNRLRE domain-containing protein [Streptomyces cyaneofuscatus]WSD45613.1 DNRLRE domain-containing protein [Streptomyces cyaneofuscatus]
MTSSWQRAPGRRSLAAAVAAVVVAAGLAVMSLDGPDRRGESAVPQSRPAVTLDESAAAAQAVRSRRAVEATALRTAYTTTWARPDGLLQRRVYASPIRARVDGAWRAIDTDLTRTSDGWSPKATNTRMVFSAGSPAAGSDRASRSVARRVSLLPAIGTPDGHELVTLTVDGHDIVLTWPDPVPEPVIDGPQALYPEILPGADLVLTADDGGFSQLLVVKNRQAAADPRIGRLAYGLGSPSLTFRLDPVTGVVTAADSSRSDIAESPTPLMWDSAGTPTLTDGEAGTTASPTAPEVLPTDSAEPLPDLTDTPEPSPEPTDSTNDGDQGDTFNEVLPEATDEAGETWTAGPAPSVPAEPSPEPTRTGAEATLALPSLNGPQPDSHGALVDTDLDGTDWVLTPDQEFLTDQDTVYPVFIDPSVKKHTNDWTTAYSRHPAATFYNGKNFNKGGTHEARVGYESDTWGTSRSYFSIDWDRDLKGSTVQSATLYALETYAWSCSKRSMSVHLTGTISSKTNWRNAPAMNNSNKIDSGSFAHGYKSTSCPDEYVKFDVKQAAKKAVEGGWDTMTVGFRAADESSQYSWKKFRANGDHGVFVDLVYNRPPTAPTGLDLDPDLSCDTTAPYVNVGASSLTFWGSAKDKDGNLASLNFELWPTGGSTTNLLGAKGKVSVGAQTGEARVHTDPFKTANVSGGLKLVNGTTYSWRAKAVDKFGATSPYSHAKTPCRFVFDNSRPSAPIASSSQFPDADANDNGFNNEPEDTKWSTVKFGTAGSFAFRARQTDVVRFEYGFNQASYPFTAARTGGAPVTTVTTVNNIKPPVAGPNVLYVRAVDGAGNVSQPLKYFFYVTPRDRADKPGDFTGDGLPDMMVVDGNGNLRLYPSEATADLARGTGDLDYSMSGSYRDNAAKDPNGDDGLPVHVAAPSGYWKNTLITHLGDVYGGDGLQDLVARREGKLWVYPGDGYGGVNIDRRHQLHLPSNAPAPDTISQIVSAGDATGDGKTDFFLTVGDALWAFVGYNGATIEQAVQLSGSAWLDRDIVTAQDVTGDQVADLVYRSESGRLLLRTGKKAATGGVELTSLSSAANSAKGIDDQYGSSGWASTSIRLLMGTPDANGDGIPDIWTLRVDGAVRFYAGSRTALSGAGTEIVGNGDGGWKNKMAIG